MTSYLDLPQETAALIAYEAVERLLDMPVCNARSEVLSASTDDLRRKLGGASEAVCVTGLRRIIRVLLRLRQTCTTLRDAKWLPTDASVFRFLFTHRAVLFPLKSAKFFEDYPTEDAAILRDYSNTEWSAQYSINDKVMDEKRCALALRVKLAQPPDSVLKMAPVFDALSGSCTASQLKRLVKTTGMSETTLMKHVTVPGQHGHKWRRYSPRLVALVIKHCQQTPGVPLAMLHYTHKKEFKHQVPSLLADCTVGGEPDKLEASFPGANRPLPLGCVSGQDLIYVDMPDAAPGTEVTSTLLGEAFKRRRALIEQGNKLRLKLKKKVLKRFHKLNLKLKI